MKTKEELMLHTIWRIASDLRMALCDTYGTGYVEAAENLRQAGLDRMFTYLGLVSDEAMRAMKEIDYDKASEAEASEA